MQNFNASHTPFHEERHVHPRREEDEGLTQSSVPQSMFSLLAELRVRGYKEVLRSLSPQLRGRGGGGGGGGGEEEEEEEALAPRIPTW